MGLHDKTSRPGKLAADPPEIEFDRVYRDRVTGFVGTCTGFASFISGCDQALLAPKVDREGKHQEGRWFDDERLIDVENEQAVERTSRRGGPQQASSRG
jgi:hypothetical protein